MSTTFDFSPLLPLHYELMVIDPPWPFDLRSKKGEAKSPQAHYTLMSDEDILSLPVSALASQNCLLLLWSTAPKLPLAMECIKRWGFDYKSFMVWHKVTKNHKTRLGTGYRVRSTGELLFVATLGNPKQSFAPQTIFDGIAREHSRKPEEFYALCDKLMPHARRADIFARQKRAGWHSFGDEVGKFEEMA